MALTKSQVRSVFGEVYAAEFAFVPPEERIDYTFSPAFCAKMDTVIARHKQSLQHRRVLRRCLVVAAAIVLTLLLVSWTPLREAVVQLLSHTDDGTIQYNVNGQLRDELETRYTPGYLPEGFTLQSQEQPWPGSCRTTYVNANGQKLILEQKVGKWIGGFATNSTASTYPNADGEPVLITFSSTLCTACWVHDGYCFDITLICEPPPTDETKLMRIIDSLQPAE